MAKFSSKGRDSKKAKIDAIELTPDCLTGRAGIALFSRYLSSIDCYPHLERLFGSLRKSKKVWLGSG